jgi:hypothetical protein
VAYHDEPVGWCAVEPRTAYRRLLRTRVPWSGRAEDKTDDGVWAVTCFVTRAGFRRRGVSRALARAAVDFARRRGARAVEGYPMITQPGQGITWDEIRVRTRAPRRVPCCGCSWPRCCRCTCRRGITRYGRRKQHEGARYPSLSRKHFRSRRCIAALLQTANPMRALTRTAGQAGQGAQPSTRHWHDHSSGLASSPPSRLRLAFSES